MKAPATGFGRPLRGDRIHRYVNAFCPHCHDEDPEKNLADVRRLSGWLAVRNDRVWLERGCPTHALVRTRYDEAAEILSYLARVQGAMHLCDQRQPLDQPRPHGDNMSIPPDPPSDQWSAPQGPPRNTKRAGVAAAAVVFGVVLIPSIYGIFSGSGSGTALIAVPVVSLACIILGSVLAISERTRQFAVGFLITSAILLFVTAGACVALIMAISSQL